MIGAPSETLGEMLLTVQEALRLWWLGLDLLAFVATPFPGTEFWTEARRRGALDGIEGNWERLALRTTVGR